METNNTAEARPSKAIVTIETFSRLAQSLRNSAMGMGEVISIKGRIYYFGTEVETLLLLKTHRFNKLADQGYSANHKSSYFAIEFTGIEFHQDYAMRANSVVVVF